MRGMVINMEEAKLATLAQIKAFLDGTSEVAFRIPKDERNQFIERVFKRFGYSPHGKADKGLLLRYIERMTGLSRQQVTRLVAQYRKHGKLSKRRLRAAPANGFASCYTLANRLIDHPGLGQSGRVTGTRELVAHQNYILIYDITTDLVRILRVLHAARQWPPVRH
jgi:hypothetical protein